MWQLTLQVLATGHCGFLRHGALNDPMDSDVSDGTDFCNEARGHSIDNGRHHESQTLQKSDLDKVVAVDPALVVQHSCSQLTPLPPEVSDRIPLDIVEQIANNLDPILDRTLTILSMATVCTSWYPCCQRILYREIVLRSWSAYTKISTLALTCAEVRRRLASTQALLVGDPTSLGMESHTLPSFPLVLVGLLPSLTKLHMSNLRPPFHSSFYRALPKLGTVTDLALFDVYVNNIHELRRILCAFPHLRNLTIGRVTYPHCVSPIPSASCKIPRTTATCRARLEALSLDWSSNHHLFVCLLQWLIDVSMCADLKSFEVSSSMLPYDGRYMIYDYLDLLMESVGPAVRRLGAATEGMCEDLKALSTTAQVMSYWQRGAKGYSGSIVREVFGTAQTSDSYPSGCPKLHRRDPSRNCFQCFLPCAAHT